MKKLLTILVATLVLTLTFSSLTVAGETWTNEDLHFSFDCPDDLELWDYASVHGGPDLGKGGGYDEKVRTYIWVTNLAERKETFEQVTKSFIYRNFDYNAYKEGYKGTVAGEEAKVFEYVEPGYWGTAEKHDLHQKVYAFEHDGYAYIIQFRTWERDYESVNARYFEPIINSFRFTSPPEPTPTPPTPEIPRGKEEEIPGFEVIFAIAGLSAVAYIWRRRK